MSLIRSILSYSATIAVVFAVSAGVTSVSAKPDKNASSKSDKKNQQLTAQQRAEKTYRKQLKKAGWKLLWEDNFTEGSLDGDNWGHEVNCTGGGNNEQQCYTDRPDNSFVDDGVLHIVAKEEAFSGPALGDDDPNYDPNDTSVTLPYTSARLRSKNKFDFTYGRVEVRAKVPGGQGMWPAIWMLPTDWVYGGWPSSGEIDIMEAVNLGVWPDEVHGTNHYGLSWPQWENHGQTLEMDVNPADDYHVYAIEWEADEIRWYVDGKHYQTQTSEGWYNYVWKGQEEGFQVANPRAPFDQNFHLILNVAAGGDWPGTPDTGWTEDREMLVDYVHVYQCHNPKVKPHRNQEGYTGAGCGTIDETVEVNTDAGAPGVNSFSMYTEGPETLSFEVGGETIDNTLVTGFWELVEGTVFQQELNLGGDHGQVWDIMFNGIGNVFLGSADMSGEEALDDGFHLAGGSGWANFGELEFDIFVAEASADSQLVVKLDSGWPNAGQVTIDMPPTGEWHHVAIKVADLLANPVPDGGGVDLSKVLNVFVLEHLGGYASLQVDNIQLQCAVNTEPEDWQLDKLCSLEPRVASVAPTGDVLDIYIDSVTDWDIFDCCGGASIAELDLDGNNVLEFTYDADPGSNTVTFFQPPAPVDLTAFAGGTVEFDMFVVSQPTNPAGNPWLIKVDCDSGCSTGDTPITQSVEGVLPPTGVWQHYTFNLDALVGQGLDLAKVSALVIFPAWGNQDNAVFRLDNVVFTKPGGGGTGGGLSDFEGEPGSYVFSDFEGGAASIVGNPVAGGINTSAQVGQMLKFAGAPWGGSTLSLDSPVDIPAGTVITMKVWSERPVPVLFKLEGMNVERSVNHGGSGWEELSFDFTGDAGTGVSAVTLIFDLGVVGDAGGDPANWTFYFDDITLPGGDTGGGGGGGGGGGTAGVIDFEPGGLGDFWSWAVFENDDNPPLEFVPNPDTSGDNPSATVAQFTARSAGQPWAGTETFDKETFTLDASNSIVKIMVYKSVVSDVGIKFAIASGGALPEIKVANTLVNEWEELTFDFSAYIGRFETIDITTLVIFPDFDFAGRTTDTVNYFDNITFAASDSGGGGGATEPAVAAPTPTDPAANVISIFSDAYSNITGVDYNPNWGQATVVTTESIAGNDTLKYAGLNYQGTDFSGNAQDVSGMTSLHLDFWSADSTALNIYLISPGPAETAYALPVTPGTWVSVDIPLTEFAGVDLESVIQFKFDGNGTIFLDNLYFTGGSTGGGGGVELAINGDFETGDTSGWTSFATENNGTFAATSAQANGGTYSGNLVASVPAEGGPASFPVVKQANIGIGTVTPNSSITISFDLYGSMAGIGGVVFAELFSELGAGGVSKAELLGGGPLLPDGTWTNYSFTTTTGNDVSGGVTLQLKADCGGNPGCMVDAYFDNVSVTVETGGGGGGATEPAVAAPTPTDPGANVISIFSDAYQNIAGVDYNPGWGQATVVTTESIAGNDTLKYAGLNYQGTDFAGNAQDVSGMTSLHLDFWSADSTELNVYLISPGPAETAYALPVTPGIWVSMDIPLTEFAGVDLANVIQFKFDGNGTIFLDNLYFAGGSGTGGGGGATGDAVNGFEGAPGSYVFNDFDGGVASIVDNPDPTGINTSAQVGQMLKYAGQPWGGSTLALDGAIDIPDGTVITMKVWSQRAVPVLFKLEGMNVERSASHGGSGWEDLSFDFSGDTGSGVTDITLIFDLGVMGDAEGDPLNWTFYFDDMILPEATGGGGGGAGDFQLTAYGAGSISDTINPDSYRCVVDFGNWIHSAGVVEPAIAGCDESTGIPTGTPTRLLPQLTGPAESKPTPTHKWWGSIPFLGEMTVGDPNKSAFITPDPITARITERGVRVGGIPAGLGTFGDNFYYPIPDPFAEVFDGLAIGNSAYSNLEGYLKDHSDGSVTVEWQSGGQAVMEATFVHGSPYIYFKAYDGELVVRTLRTDGGEKGTFYNRGDSLGIWTSVAGNHNNYLVTGEGATDFSNITGNEITVSNATNELTLTLLPHIGGTPADALTSFFEARARDVVAAVQIDHSVDRSTNMVTVSHTYLDDLGAPVETLAGMHPLHWKNSTQPTSGYQVRSARGVIKFSQTDQFSYDIPYVGVLPSLPSIDGTFDQATLENLVSEFIAQGPDVWNDRLGDEQRDVYWSGKNYGKVAELIAIAESIGMNAEATQLRDWLKSELEDWFAADTNGDLDINKYFVYDEEWNTLLGLEESFLSHQQLNDHHFHYGYLVRAAAEICRVEATWCGADQYGPMIELLIRDFAGGRDDPMFPYLRNFDPANGFSWASGMVNFARGNNNESTSEAANAYGAIVLYGLITGKDDLVERGMYLHASTAAAYWEYWNNIDGYNNVGPDENNFPAGYERITTSIIWGDGAVFSTWFSSAVAHILGIQGLPMNPLVFHVGMNPDYMVDYVALGLSESANGKPSGLVADQWRDVWWNLWAMIDADAAIADYDTVASYTPEAGETRAHTYHWIHTFSSLGHLKTGTGELTADHPAALAFDNNGVMTYVVYNFTGLAQVVNYSDGQIVNAAPNGFTVVTR